MHLSNTLTPHSLNRRQDPSAKTLQASSLILAAPPSATEATSHILSHTARPSINLPHRPPIHTLPNHLRIQRLRAVSTVGTSLKLPSSVANRQEDCFRFRRLGTHRLCLCLRISVPNETIPHPPHSLRRPNTSVSTLTTTITTTARRGEASAAVRG